MMRVLKITTLVSVVVLINAVTTLLFVQNAIPVAAGPQCVSGDINGDATVDITDPIHLLSYIFQGGPEPIACAQVPGGITADELNVVLGNYMKSPKDYAYFRAFAAGSNQGSSGPPQLLLDTGSESFYVTQFSTIQEPCPNGAGIGGGISQEVSLNGDSVLGSFMVEQVAFGDGYMLEPGTVVTVQNLGGGTQWCVPDDNVYRFRMDGYWQ